jgi:hypothetical protein
MAIVVKECTKEEQCSVVRFLWAKGLNRRDIHKEILPVYGGKRLSRRGVHSWVADVSLMTKKLKRRRAEVAETTVKKTSMLRVSMQW